jgi:hypothetical protein
MKPCCTSRPRLFPPCGSQHNRTRLLLVRNLVCSGMAPRFYVCCARNCSTDAPGLTDNTTSAMFGLLLDTWPQFLQRTMDFWEIERLRPASQAHCNKEKILWCITSRPQDAESPPRAHPSAACSALTLQSAAHEPAVAPPRGTRQGTDGAPHATSAAATENSSS